MVPVIAVIDSNSNPDGVDFPIPGNDDATRAIAMYCKLISESILDGLQSSFTSSGKDIGESDQLKEKIDSKKDSVDIKKNNNLKEDKTNIDKKDDKPIEKTKADKNDNKKIEETKVDKNVSDSIENIEKIDKSAESDDK